MTTVNFDATIGCAVLQSQAIARSINMSGKIFVSYRRGDDPGYTGRLFDRLLGAFGGDHVFMDVENIAAGVDFRRVLDEQVADCDVMLVVIGKGWIDARDAAGLRRLENPDDFVRIEIESGLKMNKRIIPVLVNGASMLQANELPESIRPLAWRNATRLTHERFHADAAGLIAAIRAAFKEISFESAKKFLDDRIGRARLLSLRQTLHRIGNVLAVALIVGVIAIVWKLLEAPNESNVLSGYERALTAIALGLFAAGLYGVFWRIIELIFGWQFGSGIGGLPKGFQAVALSLATTLPLLILPPVFQLATSKQLVLPMHYPASAAMIITAAVGHLLLYGSYTPEFRGLRNILLPFGIDTADLPRAIAMEGVYAIVHFVSTVFVYQLVLHLFNLSLSELGAVTYKTFFSGLIFFLGASTFVAICYPESIIESHWVAIRGIVNGAILMVALTIGILL